MEQDTSTQVIVAWLLCLWSVIVARCIDGYGASKSLAN